MASIILFLVFIAFYVLCNTSKKAVLNSHFGFEGWLAKQHRTSRLLGLFILVMSCLLSTICFGIGTGVLYFFIVLMTLGSLIVLLNPIKLLKPAAILAVFVISLCFEFLIFN